MSSNDQPVSTPNQDAVLATIVAMVNTFESGGFGITLTVGGSLVTGILISGTEYFQRFAEFWPQSTNTKLGETLKKIFMDVAEDFGKQAKEQFEEHASGDYKTTSPLQFIHLKDARVATPSGLVPTHFGLLWRGRLSEVQAFSWGVLQMDER